MNKTKLPKVVTLSDSEKVIILLENLRRKERIKALRDYLNYLIYLERLKNKVKKN